MSTKYFCDRCKNPMKKRDHDRLRARMGPFFVEVMIGTNHTYNAGLLCHACVRIIVANGKVEAA